MISAAGHALECIFPTGKERTLGDPIAVHPSEECKEETKRKEDNSGYTGSKTL